MPVQRPVGGECPSSPGLLAFCFWEPAAVIFFKTLFLSSFLMTVFYLTAKPGEYCGSFEAPVKERNASSKQTDKYPYPNNPSTAFPPQTGSVQAK